jgi:glycerophosphoryl diester phosphodiesterase
MVKNKVSYFSEPKPDFEPRIDRYIAHAGGMIDGVMYTNSKEALDKSYESGFRYFELDIELTSDGHFVAAHDWKHWAKETGFSGDTPVSRTEFLKYKIRGKYTTLDMEGINKWFANHPDAVLVTDKVNSPARFGKLFVDKSRLIMELFSLPAIREAELKGISVLISELPLSQIQGDVVSYLKAHKVGYVALSRRNLANKWALLKNLREQDLRVYVYHVNFDAGKDEAYVLENELGFVYGMYADDWLPGFSEITSQP